MVSLVMNCYSAAHIYLNSWDINLLSWCIVEYNETVYDTLHVCHLLFYMFVINYFTRFKAKMSTVDQGI